MRISDWSSDVCSSDLRSLGSQRRSPACGDDSTLSDAIRSDDASGAHVIAHNGRWLRLGFPAHGRLARLTLTFGRMRILTRVDAVELGRPAAVAIGVFAGVHLGHQHLLVRKSTRLHSSHYS